MQIVFIAILIGVLLVSVCSFAVLGLARHRRVASLARRAHEKGMRFVPRDPFDVPRRYARFELIRCGHSAHAENVTHGRVDGWPVRAFDFRFEAGHGTRGLTRQYGVVVADTDLSLPAVLMWHEKDLDGGPLTARQCDRRKGMWVYMGDEEVASRLAGSAADLDEEKLSIQTSGSSLMLCLPAVRRGADYTWALQRIPLVLAELKDLAGSHLGAEADRPGPRENAT